jgi:hypothetical protein
MPPIDVIQNPDRYTSWLLDKLVECRVPEGCHGGLIRYVVHHIPTGSFLLAVLMNDLAEACARADDENRYHLFDIVMFLYNHVPTSAWGSPEHVKKWLQDRPRPEVQS